MPMAHLGGGGGLNASRSYDSWGDEESAKIGTKIAGSMSETRFNDGPEVSELFHFLPFSRRNFRQTVFFFFLSGAGGGLHFVLSSASELQ